MFLSAKTVAVRTRRWLIAHSPGRWLFRINKIAHSLHKNVLLHETVADSSHIWPVAIRTIRWLTAHSPGWWLFRINKFAHSLHNNVKPYFTS